MLKVALVAAIALGMASCSKTCECDFNTYSDGILVGTQTISAEGLCKEEGLAAEATQNGTTFRAVYENCRKIK
mgnify:CR=1 FL=1